jgi:phosphatidylinositol alpha-1,6-mannosyltransferase
VCLSRDTPLKGLDRAVSLARALGEPLRLVGAREQGGESTAGVEALGPLPRTAARAALASARAAVLLPRCREDGLGAEGLGLALLEAAAAGTPAIGCQTGGVPEAVGPGLVLEDPDEPDLARVRTWLAGPERGAAARAWVTANHGPAAFRAALREVLA